jgi:hypothetical protein
MDMKRLLLVCDDAGHASVDRGIRAIADATGMPLCAEYLILTPDAPKRAKEMSAHPLVSIGLHFELADISDADRVAMANDLKTRGTVLGEQADIREKAMVDAATQLALFREALGRDPAHVSTHGDFNVDASGEVMAWWIDLMDGLFDGNVPLMQWANPHVRHNLYSWNKDATKRSPCTPKEFEEVLRAQTSDVVEFVMHPALPEPGDASIDMLFTAEMRVADVESAIAILRSDCIEKSGYRVVPVSEVR